MNAGYVVIAVGGCGLNFGTDYHNLGSPVYAGEPITDARRVWGYEKEPEVEER